MNQASKILIRKIFDFESIEGRQTTVDIDDILIIRCGWLEMWYKYKFTKIQKK